MKRNYEEYKAKISNKEDYINDLYRLVADEISEEQIDRGILLRAKEFRGKLLRRACSEYGMNLHWRPVGRPHFGGHIERLLGTFSNTITGLDALNKVGTKLDINDVKDSLARNRFFRGQSFVMTLIEGLPSYNKAPDLDPYLSEKSDSLFSPKMLSELEAGHQKSSPLLQVELNSTVPKLPYYR